MQVYMMGRKELRSLPLPEKVSGQHTLEYTSETGEIRPLLRVNARNDEWHISETSHLQIRDAGAPNESRHDYVLYENAIFYLRLNNKETIILLVVPESADRSSYSYYKVPSGGVIDIGQADFNQIQYENIYINEKRHLRIRYKENKKISVSCCDDEIPAHLRTPAYLNHRRIEKELEAKPGDCVFLFGLRVIIGADFISINNPDHAVKVRLEEVEWKPFIPTVLEDDEELIEYDHDYFSSAPREVRETVHRIFKIENPPDDPSEQDIPWIVMMGPSVTMAMGSVFSSVITINNILAENGSIYTALPSLIASVVMVLGSIVWPVIGRRIQNRGRKRKAAIENKDYEIYLQNIHEEILKEETLQKEILLENNPGIEACVHRIEDTDETLWERSQRHNDFLKIQIGKGDVPLDAEFSYPEKGFRSDLSLAASEMYELLEQKHILKDVPITLPLKGAGVIGVTGDRRKEISFAKALLIELTALHNYEDLKIFFIYNEKERSEWEFVKWIPHVWNDEQTFRFVANDPDEVRSLSEYISALISVSKSSDRQNKGAYYIVFAMDRGLAERAQALKEFYQDTENADMTVLAFYDERASLPKACSYVIDLTHEEDDSRAKQDGNFGKAIISNYNDITGKIQICSNRIGYEGNPEQIFIRMSNIQLDSISVSRQIPTEYTFLEMMGAGKPEHLDLARRWKENSAVDAISTPIGVDVDGYLINIDLHEKAHGPHGCIAGMTGSGKSEFIISMIAGLAINYSPEDVAFVLIDFKGGGMADIFKNLPHTAGLITNLDGNELRRSFLAIEHELEKRQKLFKEISEQKKISNIDIYKYQKLRRTDSDLAPLPHLILISDEFAELKQQQGDFMGQLIRIARIGRSLGIHLILATQKPEGVVDEQIKSNIRFKVCLKVQDKGDSQSMIGRPDATLITNAGRFYFQVGNNEVFEYGQSPWSGALYEPMDHVRKNVFDYIEVLNEQGRVICRESIPKKKRPAGVPEKQIDAVVDFIREMAEKDGLRAEKLWLNPLPAPKAVDKTNNVHETGITPFVLNPIIGKYDDLLNQKHLPLTVPFTREGNALLYGAGGSGQLEFLIQMLITLMDTHTPSEVKFYLCDFDEGSLAAFAGSPYTARYACMGENQEAWEVIEDLMYQLSERRERMRRYGGDYQNYVKTSGKTVPNLLLIIHNYQNFEEYFDDARINISKLAREGIKFGIYILLTGTTENSIRYTMRLLFRNIYTLYQNSDDQYRELVGKTEGIVPAHVRGRGLVRVNNSVCEFQTDIAFEDEANKYDAIRKYCSEKAALYPTAEGGTAYEADSDADTAENNDTVNVLPAEIQEPHSLREIPISIDTVNNVPVTFNMLEEIATIIIYDDAHLRPAQQIIKQIKQSTDRIITIPADQKKGAECIDSIWNLVLERSDEGKKAKEAGQEIPAFELTVVLVEEPGKLIDVIPLEQRDRLKMMIQNLTPGYKIHFIIVEKTANCELSLSPRGFAPLTPFRKGILLSKDILARMFFEEDCRYEGDARNPGGYLIDGANVELIDFLME